MAGHETISTHTEDQESAEQTPIAERLSQIDLKEITPEDVEFMNGAIQDYMRENFQVPGEIIDQIPDHVKVLNQKEFAEVFEDGDNPNRPSLDNTPGFYRYQTNESYINAEVHQSPAHLFGTMFHESSHYASINNGAGFSGNFLLPEGVLQDQEAEDLAHSGYDCLKEGATQAITKDSLEDMGVSTDDIHGYEEDTSIVRHMFRNMPHENLHQRYFQDSTEQFRQEVEATIIADDTERMNFIKKREQTSTGGFAHALLILGAIKRDLIRALERGDKQAVDEIGVYIANSAKFYEGKRDQLDVW